MQLTGETKFFIAVAVITIAILIGAVFFLSKPPVEISAEKLTPPSVLGTGPDQPKAVLVEFADFECPACGSAYPIVKEIVASHKDSLRYVFRHFPLDQHKSARLAAESAEAAGAQGKFWEMHSLLFENQSDLSREHIASLAAQLELNMDKFNKELTEGTYNEKIQKDINDGSSVGVNSTPTFFLNGKKLSLFNFEQLKTEVDKAIAASPQK